VSPFKVGNTFNIRIILGTSIHNIELIPNRGGQIVPAQLELFSKIFMKRRGLWSLRIPSKEIRLIRKECFGDNWRG
jgi:large subunit ribosomal protein L2